MANIKILDQVTVDKIAAGEVIERPASIVKELVENAIDAGATTIAVEIKEGGISFIRITDNGCGISGDEIPLAFLRHATSKLRNVEELFGIASLGFRGEALSSIAAIAQIEVITKTKDNDSGTRYVIEGGVEKTLEEVGAPNGTTFLIHQMFYNTPARRKFLKTPMTESSHVSEVMTRLALSNPEISFQFINNGQIKLHTSGSGDLKEVIYHVFGRDVSNNLIEVNASTEGVSVKGFIGNPTVSRGNRNYENYYVNGRYIKNQIIAKALEDAYKGFMMQHKYPFTVLHFKMDGTDLDINVHPTKMEIRFSNQQKVFQFVYQTIQNSLNEREQINRIELPVAEEKRLIEEPSINRPLIRESSTRKESISEPQKGSEEYFLKKMRDRVTSYHNQNSIAEVKGLSQIAKNDQQIEHIKEAINYSVTERAEKSEQLNLFEEKLLSKVRSQDYILIGQVFDTYWLVEFADQLYIIDQHAAHERVLYEKMLKSLKSKEFTSQYITPPIVLTLSMEEARLLEVHMNSFTSIGYEIESFGGEEYVVRAVPDNLFHIAKKELLIEMLDNLSDSISTTIEPELILEKIASMSCKGAVKGNSKLSKEEVDVLIGTLLELENPYHCPHGRPTIIAMTKRELEKKFKRIV